MIKSLFVREEILLDGNIRRHNVYRYIWPGESRLAIRIPLSVMKTINKT